MKLKTFIAIFLLILTILFSSVGIVSFYLNNSQINMLKDKSIAQFQTIVSSLDRDIAVLRGRGEVDFYGAVDTLVRGYARYYGRHGITISVAGIRAGGEHAAELTFANRGDGHFILITGRLPMSNFLVNYSLDITESITNMRNIQNALLVSAIVFSVISAAALYVILSSIFKPLTIVAETSREIANGKLSERIPVGSKNELSQVALDFNKMAERVQRQMILLEEEALNKQQFVDNFAHEMRTPLTSIYGYAEYMHKALLDDGEVIEISSRIMDKASYLKEIANSLLQLAMLRDYVPTKQEVSIPHLFDDISQTVKAQSEDVKFTYACNANSLNCQEDLIKSLLLNLCQNAIKACTPNEGIICMTATENASGVTISVTDNGCGIPAESVAKVTEPFYRVDEARNRKHGGAGLGLALCRKIAEVHGAELAIKSTPNEGTTVSVTFTTP
ncbi:MAG: HAMP domain-containing histidine kinase [Defluviitaleaceae bacterium]|nr:HAMP domain-containing histidine kinase [Defluviitaleaceae bacterium]MCL2263656.1 HAMP domain-containing histidine kinase [Defluviitaleaceae bacterium]MCL2263889.1 HAMP domain-containing histidine kinase [Defluviitaleaceae bacterium]MCL2264147.1 HAMP domain-containing histidine kinase [Defluviitaleaceae bacterium]